MSIAWVCTDKDGKVDAASLVEWTEWSLLVTWFGDGRSPKLIDFGESGIVIGRPLPESATILKEFKP